MLNIKDKQFELVFSFEALVKLEDLGVDVFGDGLKKLGARTLKALLQAGLAAKHKPEEIDALIRELTIKDIKQVAEAVVEELDKALK